MHDSARRFHLPIGCVKGVQALKEAYPQNGKQLQKQVRTEKAL